MRKYCEITAGLGMLLAPRPVFAGMPMTTLTEFATDRLIGISTALFFVLVIGALLVKFSWNALVSGTSWSKLTYWRSVTFTFLGGLLFFLVLVMIDGAREFFSPGAWRRDGILYSLTTKKRILGPLVEHVRIDPLIIRKEAILKLRDALWQYADKHGGDMPDSAETLKMPDLWLIPFGGGTQYEYSPDESTDRYLLAEPKLLGLPRYAITQRGILVTVTQEATK